MKMTRSESVRISYRSAREAFLPIECRRCSYYDFGECHFNAPTAAGFPKVGHQDWCTNFETTVETTVEFDFGGTDEKEQVSPNG